MMFPEKVIKSVAKKTANVSEDDPVPSRMNLSPSMTNARLEDSTVSYKKFR